MATSFENPPLWLDAGPPPDGEDAYGAAPAFDPAPRAPASKPAAGGDKLPVVCAAEWAGVDLPTREWICGDVIPRGTSTLLTGLGGTGKSLLAVQLAVACAAGAEWLGRPVARVPVVALLCEDDAPEVHRRVAAIASGLGVGLADLAALHVALGSAADPTLFEALDGAPTGKWLPRLGEIEALVGRHGAGLLLVDTLGDVFAGNENARRHVREFLAGLNRLAAARNCAVIVVAHPSKSSVEKGAGYSGSTAWLGGVRALLSLERPAADDSGAGGDSDARVLRLLKSNYGPAGLEIGLRYAGGMFAPTDTPGTGFLDRVARDAQAEQAFVDGMNELARQGREVSSLKSSAWAPRVVTEVLRAKGQSWGVKPLAAALERLMAAGRVTVVDVRENGKTRKRLRLVDAAETVGK
jgi:RecA-family ATPase